MVDKSSSLVSSWFETWKCQLIFRLCPAKCRKCVTECMCDAQSCAINSRKVQSCCIVLSLEVPNTLCATTKGLLYISYEHISRSTVSASDGLCLSPVSWVSNVNDGTKTQFLSGFCAAVGCSVLLWTKSEFGGRKTWNSHSNSTLFHFQFSNKKTAQVKGEAGLNGRECQFELSTGDWLSSCAEVSKLPMDSNRREIISSSPCSNRRNLLCWKRNSTTPMQSHKDWCTWRNRRATVWAFFTGRSSKRIVSCAVFTCKMSLCTTSSWILCLPYGERGWLIRRVFCTWSESRFFLCFVMRKKSNDF